MSRAPSPVTLLMAIHCHQPVGNFDHVFEEAYAKSYDPFLRVVERHPAVRLALHYSGPLLEWFERSRPEFLTRLRRLVERGQIEMLAAGYYEPILPLIPEADRQGQLARMQAALRRHLRAQAVGLWLTERVWEPELPSTLSRAGIRYTMVDTNQFAITKPWLPERLQVQDDDGWDVCGSYMTEYTGAAVRLFPASQRLRYWLPFQPVERTIEFLRRAQRHQPMAFTFADDGEKFGFWPQTYRWVYEEGWLERFFTRLEQERSWLTTMTFREYASEVPPDGRVFLPCGSYEEMLTWSGGHFRNFFTKYPEADAMQQKMLRLSKAVSSFKSRVSRSNSTRETRSQKLMARATQELYAGQCNCAYWHGVFGGLYLSHLRRGVYHHLIAAEQLIHQASGASSSVVALDADADGEQEVGITTDAMSVLIDPSAGGAILEWNLFAPRINLVDTLSRRPEPYHETLKAKHLSPAMSAVAAETPASIHALLGAKEEHLETHLVYDDHRRSAFIDYALRSMPTLEEVARSRWGSRRLWSGGEYRQQPSRQRTQRAGTALSVEMIQEQGDGRIRKTVTVATRRPTLACRYAVEGAEVPVVAIEFNLSLRDPRYLTAPGEQPQAARFHIEEAAVGVSLQLAIDPPATLFHFPIETVSESEEGLERTYQGLCVLCCWPLHGASSWAGALEWTVL